jgi:CrcB protein
MSRRPKLWSWHAIARLTGRTEIMVAAGAIVGVLARHTLSNLATHYVSSPFPVGTLFINLAGCLVIGVVQALFADLGAIRREAQLFLSVGFCGGFTTFSTFSIETIHLIQSGHAISALVYQVVSLAGGMCAVILAMTMTHRLHRHLARRHL